MFEYSSDILRLFLLKCRIKADRLSVGTVLDDLFQSFKCSAADKEDVCGIDLKQFLMRMLSSSLRRNRSNRTLQDFQQCLLHTFTGHISGDRCILRFSCDLVDLININDTMLCFLDIIICCLNNLQQNILHVLADISRFRQCCRICDRKRYIQKLRQCLCEQCFTGTGRTKHQDITFLQFYIQIFSCKDSLVMIVNSNRKCFFGLILSDHIIIQECLNLLRFQKIDLLIHRHVKFIF